MCFVLQEMEYWKRAHTLDAEYMDEAALAKVPDPLPQCKEVYHRLVATRFEGLFMDILENTVGKMSLKEKRKQKLTDLNDWITKVHGDMSAVLLVIRETVALVIND